MPKGVVVEPQELGEGLGVRAVAGIARGAVQNVRRVWIIGWCPRNHAPPSRDECKEGFCGRTIVSTETFWILPPANALSTKTKKPLDFAFYTGVHLRVMQTKRLLRRTTRCVCLTRHLSAKGRMGRRR